MADLVAIDNQRDASLLSPSAPVEPVMDDSKPGMIADKLSAANDTDELTDNQLTHENTDASEEDDTEEDGEDTIRQSDVDRRLTWIGEGLLNGEGLDAVEQLMNLPSVPSPPKSPIADVATNANEAPMRVERSGSKLLDFLAKEEGYVPNQTPTVANVRAPPPATPTPTPTPTKEATSPTKETKRANKLLDFLATEVGERYLDDVYADEDREDEQEQPEPTPTAPTPKEPGHANNKLLAFLAKERGERLHEVEKIDTTPRPEPYGVTLRFETADANADANTDADKPAPISSTEPTPTETKLVEPSAERNRLAEFVKNVQPPSRPKFVIFNPDDLVSSSSSSSEGEGEGDDSSSSPTGHVKELKLKKRSTQGRVRFANPGLDIQSGVVRQGIVDHYGREELLDFVVQVDEKSLPHAVPEPPVERTPTPPPRHESPTPTPTRRESPPPVPTPPRRESPPPVVPHRRESPKPTPTPTEQPTPTVVASPPGRLAAFLRKFSSKGDAKNKSGSEHGSSRGSSRSNSPDVRTRHSTPPPSLLPPAPVDAQRRVPPPPPSAHQMPAFQVRTSVESEPEMATPVERKIGGVSSMFAPSPRSVLSSASANDSSDKRLQLLATLRQLLEDAEKNELSDIAMVRISILLSTVNQIVREDLSKERPPQGIMRRLSMLVPNNESVNKAPAPWVRSNQAMEEYERGHTTTIADIEKQIDQRKQSPSPPRAPSPQLTLLPVDGTITENAMTAFTEFETAQNLSEILHAFDRLLLECGVGETDARTPLRVYNHVKSGLYTQFAFRQKQLFRLLDAKLATDVYKRQPCLQKRVCVVGCGPVGLRAAVELALLGAQVVVIDKRKLFSRENILHMWPWVVQDLTSLGAKVFFPQFCHSSAYFHVGTRQLQCILLKVALLLGVKVYPGTSFEGLAAPDSIVSDRKSFYTVVTKPQIPWMEFTAVLGACGTKDKLSAHAGIKRFVFSRKEAIGLVCYFPNLGTNEEKKVKEFSWTIQFKQRMFAKMREIGIDLENVVYYRGEYHYIVMTPKRSNLLAQGVLKINYPIVSDLVAVENIDAGALNDYVARIINFFEIPQKSEFARVRLFDFSSRTRAAQAANVLSSRGKKLYVGLIGDALMEPFWPEGLGTCRGFLSAMDACWMVAQIGKQSDEQILADRELGYRIMQHISGFQRDDLQKNVRKYNVDPTSRYTVQYPAAITY